MVLNIQGSRKVQVDMVINDKQKLRAAQEFKVRSTPWRLADPGNVRGQEFPPNSERSKAQRFSQAVFTGQGLIVIEVAEISKGH